MEHPEPRIGGTGAVIRGFGPEDGHSGGARRTKMRGAAVGGILERFMAHHPAIRVLLATLVAFWSPAWCCCRVLEAGQATPGHPSGHDDGAEHAATHDTPPSCSGHAEDDCSPCGGDGQPGDKCGCQNHDRQVDVTRSVELPPLRLAGLLDGFVMALPPTIADLDALATKQRLRSEAATAVGAVRAQTLHAQRCLLLI